MQTALMHDAILLYIEALNSLKVTQDIQTEPVGCDGEETWAAGLTIVSFMKRVSIHIFNSNTHFCMKYMF